VNSSWQGVYLTISSNRPQCRLDVTLVNCLLIELKFCKAPIGCIGGKTGGAGRKLGWGGPRLEPCVIGRQIVLSVNPELACTTVPVVIHKF